MSLNVKSQLLQSIQVNRWPTPFYYYDLEIVKKNFLNLQRAMTPRFEVLYSVKANPHESILKTLLALGASVDISSSGELVKVAGAGFHSSQISFVGPGKSVLELQECIERNIKYIVVESVQEIEILNGLAIKMGANVDVVVRINPRCYFLPNGAKKVDAVSQFGIDEQQVFGLKNVFESCRGVRWAGLHFYLQSHYLDANYILNNFKSFFNLAAELQNQFSLKFKVINLGGGFGIPYFGSQSPLDLNQLHAGVVKLLDQEYMGAFENAKLLVESGRYIVGPAGFFVAQVLYKKKSQSKAIVVCDGGISQHQAAVGVGQVVRRSYPVTKLTTRGEDASFDGHTPTETVTIVGPSCYSADVLAQDICLEVLEIGDCIVVEQSGAYGATFSPQQFLSRPLVGEYSSQDLGEH